MGNANTNTPVRRAGWTALQKGIIAILGAVMLCVLVSFFLLIRGGLPTVSLQLADNTATSTSTPTGTPTNTFTPTDTFTASPTDAPTLTETPTETYTPTLRLNPTLAAMPTTEISTVTPGPLHNPICASYFQKPLSTDFIQGSWTNDPAATKSMQACYAYMENAILNNKNCAQPDGISIMIVLIDQSRHTYDLPDDLNFNTEFIAQKECSH
jgi:hypothetical protein